MKTKKNSTEVRQKLDTRRDWNIGIISNLIVSALFFGIQLFLDNKLIYSGFIVLAFFGLLIPVSLKIDSRYLSHIVMSYLLIVSVSGIVEYKFTELNWIILESDYVHLGDVTLEIFKPPSPDGISKTYKFNLDKVPKVLKMKMTLKDVDPDPRNGPIALYINNAFVMYLNKYFSDISPEEEHEAPWRLVKINEIPAGLLKTGENTIIIAVEKTILYGFDDVNFYDLSIGYK